MNPAEFFTDPNGHDLVVKQDGKFFTLDDKHTELIQFLYDHIRDLYPDAFKTLHELYGQSWNFKFLIIIRFSKCNFSVLDDKNDIQPDHSFKLEFVSCPLRGECRYEHIICRPKLNTSLSNRELEILKLICNNLTAQQIADKLFLSFHTVDNHRKNILRKINEHNIAGIVDYAHKNNLI